SVFPNSLQNTMMGMSQLLLSVVAGIFLVLDPSAGQTYTTLANQMADSALEQISCELKRNGFDPVNITFAPVTQSATFKIPPIIGPLVTVTATLLLTGVVTGLSNVARNEDAELTVGVTSALKLPIQIAPVAIDVTGTMSFNNLASLNREADITIAVPPIQMEINAGMDFSSNTISFSHVISPINIDANINNLPSQFSGVVATIEDKINTVIEDVLNPKIEELETLAEQVILDVIGQTLAGCA
ncbi:unnamed protein product, partial [Cyprideis torosa]